MKRLFVFGSFAVLLALAPLASYSAQSALPGADSGRREEFVEPKDGRGEHVEHWYLGVYGQYTPAGLLLTEVCPRTAAANSGLEFGDRIVAVNGHQLGSHMRQRLTIDVALQRYANSSGWVRLLVQDRRTQRLINVHVRLTRRRVHT